MSPQSRLQVTQENSRSVTRFVNPPWLSTLRVLSRHAIHDSDRKDKLGVRNWFLLLLLSVNNFRTIPGLSTVIVVVLGKQQVLGKDNVNCF